MDERREPPDQDRRPRRGAESRAESHLRALEIAYYVWGALVCFFGLIATVYIVIGVFVLQRGFDPSGADAWMNSPPGERGPLRALGPEHEFLGWVFIAIGAFGLILAETLGILTILAGRKIARRSAPTFTFVVAAINCLSIPFGTALGVCTFLLLSSPDAKELYAEARSRRFEPVDRESY